MTSGRSVIVRPLVPHQVEVEEVRRAGDARVVVADRALALEGEGGLVQVERASDEMAYVVLDPLLVLRRGCDDAGGRDVALRVQLVAVEEQTAGGLRRRGPVRRVTDG